jgi:site-specific DNA recombinase
MQTAAYIRVSTYEQVRRNLSLDMQISKICSYAEMEGMEIIKVISDEGFSASTISGRPGALELIEMIKSRQIEAVLVYRLDRLARCTSDALAMAKLMDSKGVALHSISERLDTKSIMGRFFFTILASIAEMEREIIRERICDAMERKRQRGEPCNGNPSFGFHIVDDHVVPDPYEQAVIRRVRELRDQRHTIHRICDQLAEEGFVNRKGRPIAPTQIHTLIARKAS